MFSTSVPRKNETNTSYARSSLREVLLVDCLMLLLGETSNRKASIVWLTSRQMPQNRCFFQAALVELLEQKEKKGGETKSYSIKTFYTSVNWLVFFKNIISKHLSTPFMFPLIYPVTLTPRTFKIQVTIRLFSLSRSRSARPSGWNVFSSHKRGRK